MRIAAAQISCVLGDLEANLAKVREFSQRAKDQGADLVVFPEMVDTGYAIPVIRAEARAWDDGAVPVLREIAKGLAITIICGVSERADSFIYNAQVAIGANGDILGKYRKTHLFAPAPIEEDKCFKAGSEFTTVSLGPFHLGLSICYDIRFPEVYRHLAVEKAANVFIISSAWPFPRVEHLRVLALARAIENQSYVIVANRCGSDAGVSFCGNSVIVDPSGVVIAAAPSDREELIQAEISEDALKRVRERMHVFTHRRPELYERR